MNESARRDFVRSVIGGSVIASSYAAAVMPAGELLAQIQKTDSQGLKAGSVMIPASAGFQMPAYVAMPASSKPKAVLLVVHEVWGVHEYIQDVCRRFAKQGYLAIAPELFIRHGDVKVLKSPAEIFEKVVNKVADEQVFADLDSAALWAQTQGFDGLKLGITGFCWGGRITWLSATLPEVKAGVAWYGRLVGDKTANNPRQPVEIAADLKAPVLGLYGSADTGIPLDTVEQMKAALAKASSNPAAKASKFEIYPDAPHAFHADYRNTYREGPAKDGWAKCLAWFKQYGVS